jgi:hypothetical protein
MKLHAARTFPSADIFCDQMAAELFLDGRG